MKSKRIVLNRRVVGLLTIFLYSPLLLLSHSALAATGLMSLYQQAQQRDANLLQAQAQFSADQELLNQAQALLLPNVAGQLSYQQNDYSKPVFMAPKENNIQRITLSQSLFDAATWARYDQAKAQVAQAEVVYKLSQQNLILRLSQAYFDVLRADQLLTLALAQQASTGKQRDQIAAGVEVGLTNPVDLLEVQARYDLAVADEVSAQNQLTVAQAVLARLIGAPTPILKTLSLSTQLPKLSESPLTLSNQQTRQNLTVQLNDQKLKAAEFDVDASRAAHYPTVNLQASMSNQDATLSQSSSLINYPYQTNSIGINVNVPLYAGGMVSSQVRKAEYQRTAAQEGLRNANEQARVDILTLANTIQMTQLRLVALRQAVKSNEAFLTAAEEGNRIGLKNLVDVLNARTLLLKAKQDLANGLYDDVLNRLKLKAAQGTLATEDLANIEAFLRDEG